MATAEELLAPYQCDDILEVDLETRQIIIPDTVQNLGVESDDSVRILHFRVPRHYCEVDLSSFVIRINYKNTSGTGGVYSVSNPVVEDDTIKFDWIVARQVVVKKGDVLFNVCLREILDEVVNREFNTAIATLPVLEGLEMEEALIEPTYDYIEQLREILGTLGNVATAKIGEVSLPASAWTGGNNLWSQVVEIDGVTDRSQVDLTPSVEQLVVFHEKDLTFVTENDGGEVTVYAIGQKPTNDYTIQVTITEVSI